MATPNAEKGARYLSQLDASLCAGAWPDIPEHARKVDKHAPDRTCLTLAARSEAQIASASHRPTSASSSASSSIHSLGDLLPKLKEAIDAEQQHAEDSYVASVCLAEIYWLRGEEDEALTALGRKNAPEGGTAHATALGWQEVCHVKGVFIRGAALESQGQEAEARSLYLGNASRAPGSRTAELRRWTERLLARACMFMWRRVELQSLPSLNDALRCFHAWSDFWERAPSPGPPSSSHLDIGRREVWKAYYHLLSIVLQQGLVYTPSPSPPSELLRIPDQNQSEDQLSSARRRLRVALKRVEATYESMLLSETQFPKASQTNMEVEDWVERVISNWKTLSGSQQVHLDFKDVTEDIAASRNVLDILYRASTKTFHSTAILRQLFTVHASLGEFDLAMHAFDSYVEIVSKGKTRAEKTGKQEVGFDSDDTAVHTAAEAVRVLCAYGNLEQAERANSIVRTLRRWLGQKRPGSSGTVDTANGADASQPAETYLSTRTLAAAYRAIGMCKAHWARLTFENDARDHLRADAIKYLRQSQAQDQRNLETTVALALALAETRNIFAASQVLKDAIAVSESESDDDDGILSDYQRERRLMPLWHLLALCRSANDDFEQAAKMCEAAFEQYGDSADLFGERGLRSSVDSAQVPRSARGIVDQMDAWEMQTILQIKMTQLELVELMEGTDTAVRLGEELLALYTRLFGNPAQPKPAAKPPPTAVSGRQSRSGGTLRSIAGSIRPRSRSARRSVEKQAFQPPASIAEERPTTASSINGHAQQTGAPISITVTNEDGIASEKQHRHLPFKVRGHHHESRSIRSARSNERLNEKELPSTPERTNGTGLDGGKVDGTTHPPQPVESAVSQSEAPENPTSPDQPLGNAAHNAPADSWPAPPGHSDQPPKQDVRLPAPHPASSSETPRTQISGLQERQHKISLLVEIWLFIAGMYLRADLFDDCSGAIDAAFRLVEQFEEEVAAEDSSARRFYEKGWGLGKSVDELWGDVWAAVSCFLSGTPRKVERAY